MTLALIVNLCSLKLHSNIIMISCLVSNRFRLIVFSALYFISMCQFHARLLYFRPCTPCSGYEWSPSRQTRAMFACLLVSDWIQVRYSASVSCRSGEVSWNRRNVVLTMGRQTWLPNNNKWIVCATALLSQGRLPVLRGCKPEDRRMKLVESTPAVVAPKCAPDLVETRQIGFGWN